jgi:hypothetical protein
MTGGRAPAAPSTERIGRPFPITSDYVYAIAPNVNDLLYLIAYRIVRIQ